jgi:hypothetical protein
LLKLMISASQLAASKGETERQLLPLHSSRRSTIGMKSFISPLRLVVAGPLAVLVAQGLAQKVIRTEAEADGLYGPVKSVSTVVQRSEVNWVQPDGPMLLFSIRCRECAYSADGYRTRSGEMKDGHFVGQEMAISRDGDGRVAEILVTDAQTAQPEERTVFGIFGKIAETAYSLGKVVQQETFRYDADGHRIESITVDGSGDVICHTVSNYSMNGTFEGDIVWGKDQHVENRGTYDYTTGEQHYTTYDKSGNVAEQWSVASGHVTSYWEPPDTSRIFGISFQDPNDNANAKFWSCHGSGICEISSVRYEYADAAKRNLASAEWRDAEEMLLYGVYYSYTFDQKGNWTHREVSVWNSELGTHTAYETDDRVITY